MTLGLFCIAAGILLGCAAVVCTFLFSARGRREKESLDTYIHENY